RSFYLVGGTAIALQIGHRKSIDFDLFRKNKINKKSVIDKIRKRKHLAIVTRSVEEQLNLKIKNVSFTFYQYPYDISASVKFNSVINMPDLLELGAMKAFALGRRSRWKDYVDLYYILS